MSEPHVPLSRTARGFAVGRFEDLYGAKCSVQDSSLATAFALWLGVDQDADGEDGVRMHLTQDMVRALLPVLQRFADTGSIEP